MLSIQWAVTGGSSLQLPVTRHQLQDATDQRQSCIMISRRLLKKLNDTHAINFSLKNPNALIPCQSETLYNPQSSAMVLEQSPIFMPEPATKPPLASLINPPAEDSYDNLLPPSEFNLKAGQIGTDQPKNFSMRNILFRANSSLNVWISSDLELISIAILATVLDDPSWTSLLRQNQSLQMQSQKRKTTDNCHPTGHYALSSE